MPQIIEPPTRTMPPASLPRIRWNVEQFENLFTMGFLPEKGYELIEGDIVEKMSIKYPHARVQTALLALFFRIFGPDFVVPPVSLQIGNESLPEPDVTVTREAASAYKTRRFLTPADVRLIAEIGDATIDTDLTTKAALYARAGVPEYWVIDVTGRRLLIHGTPGTDGYTQVTEYNDAETAAPLFDPTATFAVADILP